MNANENVEPPEDANTDEQMTLMPNKDIQVLEQQRQGTSKAMKGSGENVVSKQF